MQICLHSHFAVELKGLVAPLIHKYRYCAQEQRDKCTFPVCVTVSGLIDTRELEDVGEREREEARRPESKARPLEEILASSPHPTSFPLSETIAHALQTKEQRTVDIHSEGGKKRKP